MHEMSNTIRKFGKEHFFGAILQNNHFANNVRGHEQANKSLPHFFGRETGYLKRGIQNAKTMVLCHLRFPSTFAP